MSWKNRTVVPVDTHFFTSFVICPRAHILSFRKSSFFCLRKILTLFRKKPFLQWGREEGLSWPSRSPVVYRQILKEKFLGGDSFNLRIPADLLERRHLLLFILKRITVMATVFVYYWSSPDIVPLTYFDISLLSKGIDLSG